MLRRRRRMATISRHAARATCGSNQKPAIWQRRTLTLRRAARRRAARRRAAKTQKRKAARRRRRKTKGTDGAALVRVPKLNATNRVWVAVRTKQLHPGVGMGVSSGAIQPAEALQLAVPVAAPPGELQPGAVAVPTIGRSVHGALH
jgi:hypothetical protein